MRDGFAAVGGIDIKTRYAFFVKKKEALLQKWKTD